MTFNRAFVATLALVALARVAPAQRQPVIFQHGIASDASTWQSIADRLAGVYYLTPYRFTTGSQREYEIQAAVFVSSAAGLPDTTFAIGHSNGGIVSREANRQGRNLRAVVTVATPHAGAGIARNLTNGEFSRYIGYLLGVVTLPVQTYGQYYLDNEYWYNAASAANWVFNVGTYFQRVPDVLGLVYNPLLSEMTPGSGYLGTLNGAGNLGREAAAIPNRVAVVSTLGSNDGVFFRTLFSQSDAASLNSDRNLARNTLFATYFYYVFYDHYYDDYYYQKVNNAYMWYNAGLALDYQDRDWCYLIGAIYWGPYICTTSDAVVPGDAQVYPQYTNLISQLDVSHSEETSSEVTYNTLSRLFSSGALRISPPGPGGGGGGTLTGSIQGPATVTQYSEYTWSANIAGGQTPYTYVWLVDNAQMQSGSSPYFAYTNQGSSFMLTLSVIDAAGFTLGRSLSVTVESCGQMIIC